MVVECNSRRSETGSCYMMDRENRKGTGNEYIAVHRSGDREHALCDSDRNYWNSELSDEKLDRKTAVCAEQRQKGGDKYGQASVCDFFG